LSATTPKLDRMIAVDGRMISRQDGSRVPPTGKHQLGSLVMSKYVKLSQM